MRLNMAVPSQSQACSKEQASDNSTFKKSNESSIYGTTREATQAAVPVLLEGKPAKR